MERLFKERTLGLTRRLDEKKNRCCCMPLVEREKKRGRQPGSQGERARACRDVMALCDHVRG